jgi:hypothetical protein
MTNFRIVSKAGLTHLGDFHHKMRKTGRHCEAAQPTKQSIAISVLCASGLLRCARNDDEFMTMITVTA